MAIKHKCFSDLSLDFQAVVVNSTSAFFKNAKRYHMWTALDEKDEHYIASTYFYYGVGWSIRSNHA